MGPRGTKEKNMALGTSIFLLAIGAVLAFAVTETVQGIDLVVVGWILMGVGALGLILSLLFWSSFSPYGSRRRGVVAEDTGVVEQRGRVI
jgi:hypothetical protein